MKIHKCHIEVMWLCLATMFCRVTNEDEIECSYNNFERDSNLVDSYNLLKVRPPP